MTIQQRERTYRESDIPALDTQPGSQHNAWVLRLAEQADAGREYHDIVAHSLGALMLELAALEGVIASATVDREVAGHALTRARHIAASGLRDARHGITSLRPSAPDPLKALQLLIDLTGIGTLLTTGSPRPMSGATVVAVHRTTERALTNCLLHAPGATPRVHLTFAESAIVLTITDDGAPESAVPASRDDVRGGWSIDNLRERAALLGGTLTTGPSEPGWTVQLTIPDDRSLDRLYAEAFWRDAQR